MKKPDKVLSKYFDALRQSISPKELKYFVEGTDGWQGLADVTTLGRHIKGRWLDLEQDFFRFAETSDTKLVIHRCIVLHDDPEMFLKALAEGTKYYDWEGVGVFWSYSLESAECHWGHGGIEVSVTALVAVDAIDWRDTVEALFEPGLGENEREIRLLEKAPVEVIKVEYVDPQETLVSWTAPEGHAIRVRA